MIKPHGSDTLNPLYVADDAERAALIKEVEKLTRYPNFFRGCCIGGDARFRLF